ncbi:hypothetical protein FRC09_015074 [Ceratobasidium sp. 395]|nr:hypothetical protein FRC09_015074 [Ceratobasidium sp. 395]
MLPPPFAALIGPIMQQDPPLLNYRSAPFYGYNYSFLGILEENQGLCGQSRPISTPIQPLPTPNRPLPIPHNPVQPLRQPVPGQRRLPVPGERSKDLPEVEKRRITIFQEFIQLASASNHPAFAAVPPPEALRKTFHFLQTRSMRILWKRGDMRAGCAKLALRLDTEWPEWALTRTNVVGLLLSKIFDEFYYYLEDQPNNTPNNLFFIRFEKHLMGEAEYRHRSEWWAGRRLQPSAWCDRGMERGTMVYPGHPFHAPKGTTVSWRRFHLVMVARKLRPADVTKEGYVYL